MVPSKCRGCGRKVYFAVDENGTNQILDAVAPVYQLTDAASPENYNKQQCARSTTAFVSHFVTCSQRNLFSKAKSE